MPLKFSEKGAVTTRNAYGAQKYEYFLGKKTFSFLNMELYSDEFKDLNLRTVVGPGLGYQIWDLKDKSLLIELGLTYFSEDFVGGEDESIISTRAASSLNYRIAGPLIFTDHLIVYNKIESPEEYQCRNEAGLKTALGSVWALKLTNILEYNASPPGGVEKTDSSYIIGLQYSF